MRVNADFTDETSDVTDNRGAKHEHVMQAVKDTNTIDPRDFKVINELNYPLSFGVCGVAVSHLRKYSFRIYLFVFNF